MTPSLLNRCGLIIAESTPVTELRCHLAAVYRLRLQNWVGPLCEGRREGGGKCGRGLGDSASVSVCHASHTCTPHRSSSCSLRLHNYGWGLPIPEHVGTLRACALPLYAEVCLHHYLFRSLVQFHRPYKRCHYELTRRLITLDADACRDADGRAEPLSPASGLCIAHR